MKKAGKILGIILILIIVIAGIALALLPNYAARYISENGVELTSRKVNVADIDINYFSGKIRIDDLLISEENEVDTFLYFKSFQLNLDLMDILNEKYHVESIRLDRLKCAVIMNGEAFNFDGLTNHFASDSSEVEPEPDTSSVYYAIDQFEITNSSIYFEDKIIGSQFQIQDLEIKTPNGIHSENPLLEAVASLGFKSGGKINANISYHLVNETYDFDLLTESLQLNVIQPYADDFMYLGVFEGLLSTDLKIHGNLKNDVDVDISGPIDLDKVQITDTNQVTVASIEHFEIEIDSINPAKDIYEVNKIVLDTAFVRFELYNEDDNISRMMIETDSISDSTIAIEEEYYSNVFVMLGAYIHDALAGIKASNFNIDTLELSGLQFYYVDHTLVKEFDYWVTKTDLNAYGLNSNSDSLTAKVSALLNHQGILNGNATFYPKKPKDVRLDVIVDKFAMKDLSSYFHHYVAFPILKGVYRMKCDLEIKDLKLKSNNDLELQSFTLGKKQKHSLAMNVPLKLAIAMLKDRNGNIPLNVPVEGDLADPKYKVWKTVGKIFSELILKAATAPYKLIAGAVQTDEASAKNILFKNPTDTLFQNQYKRLDKLAEVLIDKPDLALLIHVNYKLQTQAEKLALMYAKSDFLSINKTDGFSTNELSRINQINESDSLFQVFINDQLKEEDLKKSIEEKAFLKFDSASMLMATKKRISIQAKTIFDYLVSKGVEERHLPQMSDMKDVHFDNSNLKQIQVQLLFDVIEIRD